MTNLAGDLSYCATDVDAVAELARRAAHLTPLDGIELPIVVARLRGDESIAVQNLEHHLPAPLAPRGAAVLHDPKHFVDYVNRLGNPYRTTVWADVDRGTIRAVLDDHREALPEVDPDEARTAGWREHTVTLELRADPDWLHWTGKDRKPMSQVDFAQHIEDALHTITIPAAADMLEVASSLQAHRQASFSQATRLHNGDIQLAYHEETTAKAGQNGALEVPREFTLTITPWVGCPAVEVEARLRYQIQLGQLQIGYALLRPDLVQRDVFESIVATMGENLITEAVFSGTAPQPLR